MVNATPRPLYRRERDPVPTLQVAGWLRVLRNGCRPETRHLNVTETTEAIRRLFSQHMIVDIHIQPVMAARVLQNMEV